MKGKNAVKVICAVLMEYATVAVILMDPAVMGTNARKVMCALAESVKVVDILENPAVMGTNAGKDMCALAESA